MTLPELPELPAGLVYVGWHRFPSLHGPWQPSAVHVATTEEPYTPLCGRRKTGRGMKWNKGDRENAEAARDGSGVCKRCAARVVT